MQEFLGPGRIGDPASCLGTVAEEDAVGRGSRPQEHAAERQWVARPIGTV